MVATDLWGDNTHAANKPSGSEQWVDYTHTAKNQQAATPRKELRLPPFKEENPIAWFKQAEAYFRIHGKTDRELWFFYVQWALTPLQEKLVQDIIFTDYTPPNAYGLLKERLLQLYEKSEQARCRKLVDLPSIGGRRPSKLLAEMSTLCPKGEQNSNLFRYMFYFRLPPRIQELLGEDDQSSVVELAARVDTFVSACSLPQRYILRQLVKAAVPEGNAVPTNCATQYHKSILPIISFRLSWEM